MARLVERERLDARGEPRFSRPCRDGRCLLLAQHPDDEDRRVVVRGKGNLSATPVAVSFTVGEHRFDANGHTFKVSIAGDFAVDDLTVDDLLGNQTTTVERGKVHDAADIIRALLPHDGEGHPAKPSNRRQLDDRPAPRGLPLRPPLVRKLPGW